MKRVVNIVHAMMRRAVAKRIDKGERRAMSHRCLSPIVFVAMANKVVMANKNGPNSGAILQSLQAYLAADAARSDNHAAVLRDDT